MRLAPLVLILLLAPLPVAGEHVQDGISWACGYGGSGTNGHPDRCGIDPVGGQGVQSVGDPQWGSAWIGADERVIGVIVHGDARAVPVKMLDRHEIVNDEIQGVPVAITYCPLCGSGIAFERILDLGDGPETLDFAPSGFLYQHDLVMWDANNNILWNQILGRPIGTLRDEHIDADHPDLELRYLPTEVTTWKDWHRAHPASTMLQAIPGVSYGGAYAGYDQSCDRGISGRGGCDLDGLHPKELVSGINSPRGPIAFPISTLAREATDDGVGIAFDAALGIVATATPGGATKAYDAGRHAFTLANGTWRDEDGQTWDLAQGMRSDGQESLVPLQTRTMYWFAWKDHNPDTALWLPDGQGGALLLEDNGKLPGFMIPVVAGVLLLGAILWRRR